MPGVLRVDSMGRNLKGSSRIEAFEGHERLWMQRKLQMDVLVVAHVSSPRCTLQAIFPEMQSRITGGSHIELCFSKKRHRSMEDHLIFTKSMKLRICGFRATSPNLPEPPRKVPERSPKRSPNFGGQNQEVLVGFGLPKQPPRTSPNLPEPARIPLEDI